MRLVRHEIIDWEPFSLEIVLGAAVPGAADRVKAIIEEVVRERAAGVCACWLQHMYVGSADEGRRIVVAIEWMCDACLAVLLLRFESAFPEIVEVELGMPFQEPPREVGAMRRVERKHVELEDGSVEEVGPFLVARHAVTVAEMEAFCSTTGYQTAAERGGRPNTFRNYAKRMGRPKRAWGSALTYYVSYLDAKAYCRWVGARLPTEREWVGAAVVDERLVEEREVSFLPVGEYPDAFSDGGVEWTGTVEAGQRAVIRSGPGPFRTVDWKEHPARRAEPLDYFDARTTFRICRSLPADGGPVVDEGIP